MLSTLTLGEEMYNPGALDELESIIRNQEHDYKQFFDEKQQAKDKTLGYT